MKMAFPKRSYYSITALLIILLQSQILVNGQFHPRCRTPIGDMGSCVSLKFCPEVPLFFQTLSSDQAFAYSRALQNLCGFRTTTDHYPIVCCTKPKYEESDEPKVTSSPDVTFSPIPMFKPTNPMDDWDSEGKPETQPEFEEPATEKAQRSFDEHNGEAACRTPRLESGFCKRLTNCSALFDELKANPEDDTLKKYLRISHKICGSIDTQICCPDMAAVRPTTPRTFINQKGGSQSTVHLLTEAEGCGVQRHVQLNKVIGGQDSQIGEWPWIALLGYGSPEDFNPFRCGGTLITARHVLTAAHCILKDLSFVRLGEHDLSIVDETDPVDINIEKAFRHEGYGTKHLRYDMAILYLERRVVFTNFIYPICMPMASDLRGKSYVSYNPFTAGWGRTSEKGKTANILQHVQLRVYDNEVCRDAYRKYGRLLPDSNFDDSVLCVGDTSGKRDSCRGDSGGPLMIPELRNGTTHYFLIGIVSHGIGCGRPNSPAVYTSSQYFLDWILEKIQES